MIRYLPYKILSEIKSLRLYPIKQVKNNVFTYSPKKPRYLLNFREFSLKNLIFIGQTLGRKGHFNAYSFRVLGRFTQQLCDTF